MSDEHGADTPIYELALRPVTPAFPVEMKRIMMAFAKLYASTAEPNVAFAAFAKSMNRNDLIEFMCSEQVTAPFCSGSGSGLSDQFTESCRRENIKLAAWLVSIGADLHACGGAALRCACTEGHLDVAKWLYSLGADPHASDDISLRIACSRGHLEVAKWLHSIGGDRIPHMHLDMTFRLACSHGHLEVSKWLYSICVDVRAFDDIALRWACSSGRLDVAKWLHSLGANPNICDSYLYGSKGIKDRHPDMYDWLKSVRDASFDTY
jgi:hypothetical protein